VVGKFDRSRIYSDLRTFSAEEQPIIKKKTEEHTYESSYTSTVLCLVKCFVGTVILFMPHNFNNGGLLLSLGIMIGIISSVVWCLLKLLKCADVVYAQRFAMNSTAPVTYDDIGYQIAGKTGRTTIRVCLILTQVGTCCAYHIFVTKNLVSFMEHFGYYLYETNPLLLYFGQMVIFVPLVWIRKLSSLVIPTAIADVLIFFCLTLILFLLLGQNFRGRCC